MNGLQALPSENTAENTAMTTAEEPAVTAPKKQAKRPENADELRTWLREHSEAEIHTTDLSQWLPKLIAMEVLNFSQRTLERKIEQGHIEKRLRSMPGGNRKSLPVLNPIDIKRVLASQIRPMVASPRTPQPSQEDQRAMEVTRVVPEVVDRMMATIDGITRKLTHRPEEPPLFMDLDSAAEVAGIKVELRPLFRKMLATAIREGKLPAARVSRGVFLVHRKALFEYMPDVVPPVKPRKSRAKGANSNPSDN